MALLAYYHGEWQLTRRTNNQGDMVGWATFQPGEGGAFYTETGHWIHSPRQGQEFYQHQIYRQETEAVYVYRATSQRHPLALLHRLTFIGESFPYTAEHIHLCGRDRYQVKYTLLSSEQFMVSYQVTGPHKDYTMETVYKRL